MGKKKKFRDVTVDIDKLLPYRPPCGVYQPDHGLHKAVGIRTLETFERRAIDILERFTELEVPDENSFPFQVRGKWRHFAAERSDMPLLTDLSVALRCFNNASRLLNEIDQNPSYKLADKLAYELMQAMYYANQAGVVSSDIWKKGQKAAEHARKRGKATKKVTGRNDVSLLRFMYNKHRSKKAWLQEITAAMNQGKVEKDCVSERTVSRRLKEIGLR